MENNTCRSQVVCCVCLVGAAAASCGKFAPNIEQVADGVVAETCRRRDYV